VTRGVALSCWYTLSICVIGSVLVELALVNSFPVTVVWVSVACLALVPLLVQDIVMLF
jgi:hypothetical protein